MSNARLVGSTLIVLAVLVFSRPLHAQIYETVGTRAQGMGGAFVAVADDATATWWNPAGLATGPALSVIFERGETTDPADDFDIRPAWRSNATGVAITFPALGLSYYRLRVNDIAPTSPTAVDPVGREDPQGVSRIRSMALSQYGATFGQSVGGALVFASTFKLLRSGQVLSSGPSGTDLFEFASELDVPVDTTVALDIGAMASVGRLRLGISAKNLREPEFGEGDLQFKLRRQIRAGGAVVGGPAGPLDAVTAAADIDLTTTVTGTGDAQYLATGAEAWLFRRLVGLRVGLSKNLASDDGASSTSVGASVGMSGLYFDSGFVFGSDRAREGWTLGARVTF